MKIGIKQVAAAGVVLALGMGFGSVACTVDFGGHSINDAGPPDAAASDAAVVDAAPVDAAPVDAAPPDASLPDAAQMDAGPNCGDGVIDANEQCDDGVNNSDTAPNACRNNCLNAWCGDGVQDTGEQCDDGPSNNDGVPNACRTTCVNPSCGDAVTDSGEQCDDGNSTNTDSCLSGCVVAQCGDNVIWSGQEECDDGNTTSGDGCSSGCDTENLPSLTSLTTTSGGWSTPWVMTWAGEPHAPTTAVRAAAALEGAGRAIIFTQSTYHVLRIPQLTWYDSGTLSPDFANMPAAGPVAGYGLGNATSTTLTIISGHMAYLWEYTHSTGNVSYTTSSDLDLDPDWQTAEAPDLTQMSCMWVDEDDDHGWVNDSLLAACGSGAGSVVGYSVSITPTQLHLQEIGNCFEFYDQMSYNAFSPFGNSVSGRPPQSQLRGTFYYEGNNTLYAVTQQ